MYNYGVGDVAGIRWFYIIFLNVCLGALSAEDSEMLNDLMPFPYSLKWSGGLIPQTKVPF
jgi:hypothetical protein